MVSTRPPTSKSSSPFSNHLVTFQNARITISIIVTCIFHSFFQFPSKVEVIIIIIIIIIYSLEFSHQRKLMVFHWRLSDSKSPQVSRTLLSILAVFNNAVVWIVSSRSPTSKSSRPFNNPLVTLPKVLLLLLLLSSARLHTSLYIHFKNH